MESEVGQIAEAVEETRRKYLPGRAMRVAAALKAKGGDEFAKPGSIIEIKFVKGESLSLTASRLLALMILTAGGDAWEDRPHRIRKADIRRGHKGNERITDMLQELHRTLFAVDDKSWRGKKATLLFSLISRSREETEEEGGEAGWIEWEFTPDARKLIQASETYAVLNRQAVLGFRSNYALKLYELGALRLHRRQATWRGDMQALRAALGIPPEVYTDFAQLRRKVLEKPNPRSTSWRTSASNGAKFGRVELLPSLNSGLSQRVRRRSSRLSTNWIVIRQAAKRGGKGTVETIAAGQGAIPGPRKAVASRKPTEASFPRGIAALRGKRIRIPLDRPAVWRRLGCGYDRRWLSRTYGRAIGKASWGKVDRGVEGVLRGLG
jgi:hypothetical protein